MERITGRVHSLESFALVDGPGVRFAVFLQGCPMRCRYCHNPDTWAFSGGESLTAHELFDKVWPYHRYWKNGGGVTVSGGEALMQMEFVTAFFTLLKAENVHTALDTAGQPFSEAPSFQEKFSRLMALTDLVLLDIKEMDEQKHIALTGHTNRNILAMARWLSDHGKPMWIRHVLVPGLTDSEESLAALRDFLGTLRTLDRVEVLPYHAMGTAKWESMGMPYSLKDARTPTENEIEREKRILGIT